MTIYVIEEISVDPMETSVGRAVWYKPIGYTDSEDKAKEICSRGRMFTRDDCWAIYGNLPQFKYQEHYRI